MDKEERVLKRGLRLKYLNKDKLILKKERDLCHFRKMSTDNYEWVDVNPPIFNGYHRYLVVRPDISKTSEGAKLKELIELITIHQYSYDRKFLVYPSTNKNSFTFDNYSYSGRLFVRKPRKGEKKVEAPLGFKKLTENEYEKLPCPLKTFFNKVRRDVPGWRLSEHYEYRCKEPLWKFSKKVEVNYIYRRKVYDDESVSKYQRLHQEFNSAHLWPKWYKAKSLRYNYYDDDWGADKRDIVRKIYIKDVYDGIKDFYE